MDRNDGLYNLQRQLKDTYEAMTGDTIYAAVQVIEEFLDIFEHGTSA